MTEKLPITLLYVEDDEPTRQAVGGALARRVERVLQAPDGAAGLELFRAHAPELVVTDIAMPGLSGLRLVRELKAGSPDTPVIITTAHSDTEYFLESIELGVDAYVLKPVSFPALFAAVGRCFAVLDHDRQRRRHDEERERLIAELQGALDKVKQLSGLLPICAGCKKIRDDQGYWQQIERYIAAHSEAQFSHGMCPECIQRLYPELADDEPT